VATRRRHYHNRPHAPRLFETEGPLAEEDTHGFDSSDLERPPMSHGLPQRAWSAIALTHRNTTSVFGTVCNRSFLPFAERCRNARYLRTADGWLGPT
jgi:hypothetical protein